MQIEFEGLGIDGTSFSVTGRSHSRYVTVIAAEVVEGEVPGGQGKISLTFTLSPANFELREPSVSFALKGWLTTSSDERYFDAGYTAYRGELVPDQLIANTNFDFTDPVASVTQLELWVDGIN